MPSPHPKHTDTTRGRVQSHTRHTGDNTTETPTTVPGVVENFRATFVLPISFHSTPPPVAPTAEAMWTAGRMWRLGVHSPFPYGLCDPRQSLHLSWGNQPSRQLFPPLSLSLSPPPSSLLGGGQRCPLFPHWLPSGRWGSCNLHRGPSLPPRGAGLPWGRGASI